MIYIVEHQDERLPEIIQAVAQIEKDTFSDAWSETNIEGAVKQDYNKLFVIYNENSLVLGYLISSFVAGETELLRIAVKSGERKKGRGKLLINEYLSYAKKLCTRGFLEVRDGNAVARNIYEKLGYKEIATRKNYYHNPAEDGIIYEIRF